MEYLYDLSATVLGALLALCIMRAIRHARMRHKGMNDVELYASDMSCGSRRYLVVTFEPSDVRMLSKAIGQRDFSAYVKSLIAKDIEDQAQLDIDERAAAAEARASVEGDAAGIEPKRKQQ